MFEVGMVILISGALIGLCGITIAPYDLEDFCLMASVVLVIAGVSVLIGYEISSKKEADKKFRSMYEIAAPCRLDSVAWCDDNECQVVIRCDNVKRGKE